LVSIFGESAKPNISHITGIIKNNDFIHTINPSIFIGFLIQDYIVDERIELTHGLIQFHGEDTYNDREIYWTDKKIKINYLE